MKKANLFVIFLTLTIVFGYAFPQTVDEIIAKHLQAKGGIEKLKGIKSIKMTGKIVVQGMEMPMASYYKRPNLFRYEGEFQGQKVVGIFDGEKGWSINPFMGTEEPMEIPEEQSKIMKEQADFEGPFVDYKEKGIKIEFLGKEDQEGTPTYKLKVTYKDGRETFVYLDIDSFLKIKSETTIEQQGNPIKVTTFFSDYKDVDGLKFPFSIQSSVGQTITIEAIEINPELEDSLFKVSK